MGTEEPSDKNNEERVFEGALKTPDQRKRGR